MRFRRRVVSRFLVLLAIGSPRLAGAANIFEDVGDPTSATILEFDPSIRSAAMGSAGTADAWDIAPNAWANPALLGYMEGLRYEHGDFSDLFDWRARRTTLGHGGLGFTSTGLPAAGLGKLELALNLTITGGGSSSTVADVERVRSWAAGASLGRLLNGLARAAGRSEPAITRYFDVAVGYAEKRVEEELSIVSPGDTSSTSDHAIARDRGVLVRVGAPVHTNSIRSARWEAAYGFSEINYNDPSFDTSGFGISTPTARDWRNGVALHAEAGGAGWASGLPRDLAMGLAPFVSAGWAMDFVHTTRGTGNPHDLDSWGAELGIANVVFGRIGHVEDSHTWGFGLQLPVGRFGGARWDHANVSRSGLDDLTRDGWTVWVDPVRIYGAMH